MKNIYLDANAQSLALPCAQEKLIENLTILGNPSSFHQHGKRARSLLDEARTTIASALASPPKSVIFTSGASESNKLFLDSLVKKTLTENKPIAILCSIFEHPSLLKPLISLANKELFIIDYFDTINTVNIKNYDVIICTQAHNETGILPDLDFITQNARPDTLIMSDICQSLGRIELVSHRVDVITASAQKMGGFAGCGVLVLRGNGVSLPTPYENQAQERGFRGGTQALLLIIAFGAAVSKLDELREKHANLEALRDYFEDRVQSFSDCLVIGKNYKRLPNTSAISFYKENADSLRISCDLAGLSVGFGSACSGLAPEPSFALTHLGLSEQEQKTAVRFSFLHTLEKPELDEALKRLKSIIKNI